MKNYTYNRATNEKFAIKGHLTADGTTIEYVNSDSEDATITLEKIFDVFKDTDINLTISVKSDVDLSEDFEAEEE